MVKTRLSHPKSSSDLQQPKQSQNEAELILAQARASIATVEDSKSASSCLACLRNSSQKFCYDSRTGSAQCCDLGDTQSSGCNQTKNAQLVCSTDKLVARSAAYEVCPHVADQCDTKTLVLNNETSGKLLDGKSQASTRDLIAKVGSGEVGKLNTSGVFEGFTISKSSASPDLKASPVTDAIEAEQHEDEAHKVANLVAKAPLIDDSYWRSIVVNSENGTVCSYELLNSDASHINNVFEIQLSGMKNLQIGLYYGQYQQDEDFGFELQFQPVVPASTQQSESVTKQIAKYSRLVDLKVFSPSECSELLHCTSSTDDVSDSDHYIQLMLSKAEFVNLNLLPVDESQPMHARISYRLINEQEHAFIIETLIFMGVGFSLIFLFIGLLFRALNPKSRGSD